MKKEEIYQKAKERIKKKQFDLENNLQGKPEKLIEELQIRQIELELQNEELQESNNKIEYMRDRFVRFFNKSPVGYLVLDERGMIKDVNDRICLSLNYERSEMLNIPLFGFVYRDDQKGFMGRFKAFFRNPVDKKLTLNLLKKDDSLLYVEMIGEKDLFLADTKDAKSEGLLLISVIDISKEQKIRQERELTESKFATLFNHAGVGVSEIALDGTFLRVNQRFAEITGYTPEELMKKNFKDITFEDDLHLDEKYIAEVMSGERDSFVLEKRYIHKQGHPVWIRLYSNVVRDRMGNLKFAIASIIDITEERAIINELEETNRKLKLAMNSANQGMWHWNLKTDEVYFDENALDMLGYDKNFQRAGSWWIDQAHPKDIEMLKSAIKRFISGESTKYQLDFRIRNKAGNYIWVSSYGTILHRYSNNKAQIFLGIHQDISKQKEKEAKMREFSYVFDSIQEPISVLDSNFIFINVNKAYQKYFNLTPDQILGHSVKEMLGEKYYENQVRSHLERCLKGEVVHYQRWFSIPDLPRFYQDVKYFPYYDKSGKVTRIIVSSRDLTQLKQVEDKMKYSEKLLDQVFNVTIPLCLIDRDYQIERVNDTFCNYFEYNKENVIGKKCYDIWQSPVCGTSKCMLKRMLKGDRSGNYTLEKTRSNGIRYSCIVNSHAIFTVEGELHGLIENFTDITYLKDAEQQLQYLNEEISSQNEELRSQNDELQFIQSDQADIIKKLQETESMLHKSNNRYRLLSDVTFEGIILHKEGKIIDANQRALKMTGYSFEDQHKINIFTLIKPSDHAQVKNNIQKQYVEPYYITVIRRDGTEFPAEIESRELEVDNQILRITAVRDITAKLEMEKALALSEHKFRFYIENAPTGFFVIDMEGNYLEFNKTFCTMTGYSREELLEMSIPDIIHPGSISKELEIYQNLSKSEFASEEIGFIRKDEVVRIWHETGRKLENRNYMAFVQDVTETIEGQRELENREKLLNFAIEQLPIPVIIADAPDVKISRYNQAVINLLVKKPMKLADIPLEKHRELWPTFYPDGTPYKIEDLPLTKAIRQGIITYSEQIIVRHPDKDHWVSASAAPLRDENGNIIAGIVVFPDITEQRETLEALKRNEKLLNEVGNIARIGGWEVEVETGEVALTKGSYDIMEIPYNGNVPNMEEHFDHYLAEYRKTVKQKMQELIKNGTPFLFEAEFLTEKGNLKWCKVVGRGEKTNGKCSRIYGTFQDITEQKVLQKAINEKQAQMTSLLNNASDFIMLGDKNGKPLFFNAAYKQVMKDAIGLDAKPGDAPHNHLKEEDKKALWENFHNRVLQGESFKIEYDLDFLDGSHHFLEVSYSPVIENDLVVGFSEITRDITDRKIQEIEIRESGEKYRLLAETHQNIIMSYDLKGKITYINPYGAEFIDGTPEEIVGRNIKDFMSVKEYEQMRHSFRDTFLSGNFNQQQIEIEHYDNEGNKKVLEISASPILKEDKPEAILVLARDITERKQIEEELHLHRNHLEQLVKERTRKLEDQAAELKKFNKLFVGREFRIKELRDKIEELEVLLQKNGIKIEKKKYEI